MAFKVESLGATAFGGIQTLAEWYDRKRVTELKITEKDVIKKFGTYTFVGVGGLATLAVIFGWMRRYENWLIPISHGFFYDIPRVAYNTSKSLGTAGVSNATNSAAVRQAEQARRTYQAQLNAGRVANQTGRTYEQQFTPVVLG